MIRIRIGEVGDAGRISELLVALSEEFIVPEFGETGRRQLLGEFAPGAMAEKLAGPFRFYLAEDGDALAGVAAVREPSHLYLLFVARPYHRQGVARALWARILGDYLSGPGAASRMTVNASNFAVAAYERLGFRRCGPQVEKLGVIANPMEFVHRPSTAA